MLKYRGQSGVQGLRVSVFGASLYFTKLYLDLREGLTPVSTGTGAPLNT